MFLTLPCGWGGCEDGRRGQETSAGAQKVANLGWNGQGLQHQSPSYLSFLALADCNLQEIIQTSFQECPSDAVSVYESGWASLRAQKSEVRALRTINGPRA